MNYVRLLILLNEVTPSMEIFLSVIVYFFIHFLLYSFYRIAFHLLLFASRCFVCDTKKKKKKF